MKHLYHYRSACRFLLTSRTMYSKAFSSMPSPGVTYESSAKVIYCVAPAIGHHDEHHDERNFRITWTMEVLAKQKLTPKFRGSEIIQLENFRTATVEDIATLHSRSYISSLKKASEEAKASEKGILLIENGAPTYVTATTFEESFVAAGAALSLVDYVVAASRVNENPPVGFALIRPPGHHAVTNGAMGFCFFGNVAIAARYAQRVHGLKRVFIIDFDSHHGNGTNDAFYDDPDIFYLSTHQGEESYPRGTGKIDDIGHGNGEGATLNLPLPKRTGDISMRTVFDEVIAPAVQRFKPDIILVSAGYDGHLFDNKTFQWKTGTYHMLTTNIKQLAKDLCGGRCVFFLEGGYNVYTLAHSVAQSFRALIGEPSIPHEHYDLDRFFYEEPSYEVKQAIEKIKHLHSL